MLAINYSKLFSILLQDGNRTYRTNICLPLLEHMACASHKTTWKNKNTDHLVSTSVVGLFLSLVMETPYFQTTKTKTKKNQIITTSGGSVNHQFLFFPAEEFCVLIKLQSFRTVASQLGYLPSQYSKKDPKLPWPKPKINRHDVIPISTYRKSTGNVSSFLQFLKCAYIFRARNNMF